MRSHLVSHSELVLFSSDSLHHSSSKCITEHAPLIMKPNSSLSVSTRRNKDRMAQDSTFQRVSLTISHPRRGCSSVVVLCYMCPQLFSSPQHPCSTLLYVLYTCTRMSYMSHNCSANADHSPSYMPLSRPSVHLVVPTPPVVQLHEYICVRVDMFVPQLRICFCIRISFFPSQSVQCACAQYPPTSLMSASLSTLLLLLLLLHIPYGSKEALCQCADAPMQ